MGNLGATEIILIFLVVLLLFGARRIPEIAKGLGKGIREFKDATNDIKRELTVEDQYRLQAPRQPGAPRYDQGYDPSVPYDQRTVAPGAYAAPAAPPAPGPGGAAAPPAGPYATGDAPHGEPNTGTANAPYPPAAANDVPPPRPA